MESSSMDFGSGLVAVEASAKIVSKSLAEGPTSESLTLPGLVWVAATPVHAVIRPLVFVSFSESSLSDFSVCVSCSSVCGIKQLTFDTSEVQSGHCTCKVFVSGFPWTSTRRFMGVGPASSKVVPDVPTPLYFEILIITYTTHRTLICLT